ncbi:MAG: Uma2 family endonuclease [Pseudomonadota bacterium]
MSTAALTAPASGDGLVRKRWNVADIEAMVAAGILNEKDRLELIDGELIEMSSKGIAHEVLKDDLAEFIYANRPSDVRLTPETTFRLADNEFLEPDFVFRPADMPLAQISGPTVLLVIEIADSSLAFDRGRKAQRYAHFGVRDYWVIDAKSLETHIHRSPAPTGYQHVATVGPNEQLTPLLFDTFSFRLADVTGSTPM